MTGGRRAHTHTHVRAHTHIPCILIISASQVSSPLIPTTSHNTSPQDSWLAGPASPTPVCTWVGLSLGHGPQHAGGSPSPETTGPLFLPCPEQSVQFPSAPQGCRSQAPASISRRRTCLVRLPAPGLHRDMGPSKIPRVELRSGVGMTLKMSWHFRTSPAPHTT